jgi:pimeloyl-ACP methyl ester carboxylesterase
MRYDPRGIGDSEGGPWGDVGFDDEVDDARLAFRHLRQRDDVDPRRVALLGWGAGGDLAALVADANPGVAGVVAWDPAIRPVLERYLYTIRKHMESMGNPLEKIHRTMDELGQTLGLILSGGDAEECRRRVPETAILWDEHDWFFQKSAAYWRELNAAPLIEAWPRARGPVLLLESEFDVTAPPGDAEILLQELERAYHPDHRLERIPGVDHHLGRVSTFREAINRDLSGDRLPDGIEALVARLLPWLRALPPAAEPAAIPAPPAEEDPK